ncbi:SH3 domain-containing protein [Urbifossiella limnaea]|uniref:SH3 domain-containing protein n=1 Tax=Urbifossiella limnaea TaxID=2528023 RepID=A0A517XMC9_9BACT|nr:hypothetical protein [Urbifossiella limnaea]QDU18669.1 hypothetical protein ETAA1_05620 [Urbifossiella limnaea]
MTLRAAVAVALLAAAPAAAHSPAPADLAAEAARQFAAGVAARDDAAAARPHFRAAAAAYDALWQGGRRNPAVGLARARCRRLAGDLPAAVVALHEALAVAPADRDLRVELDDARAAVDYPHTGDLTDQCRPATARPFGSRVSAAEAFALVAVFALAAGLAAARLAMTRAPAWLGVSALSLAALAALAALLWQDARRDPRPVVVVAADVFLRRGNADSYPPRLEPRLPRGAEARELGRRGGWVQVELAGGAAGWVPEAAVLPVPRR